MIRILKLILIHFVISLLLGLAQSLSRRLLEDRQLSRPSIPSIALDQPSAPPPNWDLQRGLIRPTYPPQDLNGHYLSAPGFERPLPLRAPH